MDPARSISSGLEKSGLLKTGLAFLQPMPEDAKLTAEQRKLKTLAREMESLFVNQMLSTMRNVHLAKDPLDGGSAGTMFRELLDTEYSRQMARRGSLGLSETIYKEFIKGLRDEVPTKADKPSSP